MAYIDFTTSAAVEVPTVPADAAQPVLAVATVVGTLGKLEWEVVRLARHDGLSSLREPGRLARLHGWLFGREAGRRLADPRLEALRRIAVFAWRYGYAVPVSAIKEFKAAGFSMDQLEAVLLKVTAQRGEWRARAA